MNGFEVADTDLSTTNGFNYTIEDLPLNVGEVKFRKDNSWTTNWGSNAFPIGTGVQDGVNIPIANDGNYTITFDRLSGEYMFIQLLGTANFIKDSVKVYPNPTANVWNFSCDHEIIETVEILDSMGKIIQIVSPNKTNVVIDASGFSSGLYFGRLYSGTKFKLIKIFKI